MRAQSIRDVFALLDARDPDKDIAVIRHSHWPIASAGWSTPSTTTP